MGFRDAPEIYGFDFIDCAAASILTLFWLRELLWLLRFGARAPRLSKYANHAMKIQRSTSLKHEKLNLLQVKTFFT